MSSQKLNIYIPLKSHLTEICLDVKKIPKPSKLRNSNVLSAAVCFKVSKQNSGDTIFMDYEILN